MKSKLRAIEHRAVSGVWLLGEDFDDIIISEETYIWLWRNIYNICDNPRLIKMFWSNSNQYFDYRLQSVLPDYSSKHGELVINNKEQVDKRNNERNKFLEFHYALGGLMLYRKHYKTLSYLFEYSQSQPPRYVLLPETMTQIFYWFESFRNEFKHKTPIEFKYFFPELDNLGSRRQVNYWICCYIVTLFLRQYSLHQYYIYQDFTALPKLPDDVLELSSWLDSASFFERCLNTVLSNKELIIDLEFDKIVETKRNIFFTFIYDLKESIKNKIGQQKLNAKLSDVKITKFYNESNEIISNAFEEYNSVFIPKEASHLNSELKLSVNGDVTIMSKSAFTENDIPNLNYDTVFALAISTNKIKRLIPNSFLIARTKRYLLNKENIIIALAKIIGNNNDIIIIGVNVGFKNREIIDSSKFKSIFQYITSTEYHSQDTLFVLRRKNLPAIEHKDLMEDELNDMQLKCINKKLKLYASVIDINTVENKEIKEKWSLKNEPDNQDLKVQIAIAFLSIIFWKNEREVIQINIASEFLEQGIQNDINEVSPLL